MPKILAIPGSYRAGSYNRKLLALAVRELKAQGAEVDEVDLKALALPVYDGDVEEQGFPPNAQVLKDRIRAADGMIVCSPEYNSSIPGGLKNAIDWASRPPVNPFIGKVVALMGATTGRFATIRMQPHLRQVMYVLGAHVINAGVYLPAADQAFDDAGELTEEFRRKEVHRTVADLLLEVRRHASTSTG